jgi:hypothetical protein
MEVTAKNKYTLIFFSSLVLLFLLPVFIKANNVINGGSGESKCYQISINHILSASNNYKIDGIIMLSNSSVIYLNTLYINSPGLISNRTFERANDSSYIFSFNFTSGESSDSIDFELCTDILAGNDTLCDIIFQNMTVNQQNIENDTIKFVRSSAQYEPLYFRQVRFDIIDEHPIIDGLLKLKVMIDCEGPVKFLLFDLLGRLSYSEDGFYATAGHYTEHEIKLSNTISSGIYMLQLHTHCGGALMEVIINK